MGRKKEQPEELREYEFCVEVTLTGSASIEATSREEARKKLIDDISWVDNTFFAQSSISDWHVH